jgi:hypothetical protein
MPAEQPRELTAADRQALAENHKKRLAETVSKQCAQALRHVQSHKVSISMSSVWNLAASLAPCPHSDWPFKDALCHSQTREGEGTSM